MSAHVEKVSTYMIVYVLLLVGLVVTVWAAEIDMGKLNTPVAMLIAVAKTALVVMFFMHLRRSSKLTQIWAGAGLFFLIIMFGITMTDYITRWFQDSGWQ